MLNQYFSSGAKSKHPKVTENQLTFGQLGLNTLTAANAEETAVDETRWATHQISRVPCDPLQSSSYHQCGDAFEWISTNQGHCSDFK
jgi:hypothetical protein